ncbi:substrate-binding domain-containing protein [Nitrospira sp. MA-1]|nr:substrate-binding domain-containing protein [Nitrospira sp. MA-1]
MLQESVCNRLRDIRKKQGISQVELAALVGLTRQAVYAIEANQYLPSTNVALRFARALKCRVEDIFILSNQEEMVEAEFIGAPTALGHPTRVKLAYVGSRILARPMAELGDVLNFVMPADGVVVEQTKRSTSPKRPYVRVQLLNSPEVIKKGILIAGCDPALFLAGEHVRKVNAMAGITNWTMGSANALRALQREEVHMAGLHLVDVKSGQSNVPYLKRHIPGQDFVGVRFASWVQGLLIQQGNPKHIRTVEDFGQGGIRLVNREVGAGARFLLDTLLQKSGLTGEMLLGYDNEVPSHLEVARLIRDGIADVGIGVEAAARHFGLDFIPLREEQYDLIMRREFLTSHPVMSQFLDAMVSHPFRREIESLGGYTVTEIGKILHW